MFEIKNQNKKLKNIKKIRIMKQLHIKAFQTEMKIPII